ASVRTSKGTTWIPVLFPAAWTLRTKATLAWLPGLVRTATVVRPGTMLARISSRFGAVALLGVERPVMLAPGWARLFTKPLSTGSPGLPITIGMVLVAACAAAVA